MPSESVLKQMTGGERMTVRHLNRGFLDFYPHFKLTLSFNQKPQVRGQDEGIWRRIRMVPFDVRVAKPDKGLKGRLLDEGPGVLNWLLDGFRLWREHGLVVPDAVAAATQDYREESDPVGQFLAERTIRSDYDETAGGKLYTAYEHWCKDNGFRPISGTAFGRTLGDRGLKKRTSTLVYYQGIKLVEATESTEGSETIEPV